MLNILINAYAVSPNWGSEPGMGWNWVINIAKYCNVHVITEGEWKDEILAAVAKLPQKDNLHFYFNPVPDKVRKMCWNQGDWRFYYHYARWQRKTLDIARKIVSENHIDVMHQLNMIGFREPGYLYRIKDIPLVWGPIGGMGNIPTSFLKGAGWKQNIFNRVKNFVSDAQIILHPRVRKMMKRSFPIAAVAATQQKVMRYYGKDIPLINETGTEIVDCPPREANHSEILKILWVGKFDFRKRLDIALKAIAMANNRQIELKICGTGSETQVSMYRTMAKDLGIDNQIKWLGTVQHDKISDMMAKSDLLFFTSISEATSTVVVEAITAGLPILSFNACGFGPLVSEFAGVTIPVETPSKAVENFAREINILHACPERLREISKDELANAHRLSWEYKGKMMNSCYNELMR